MVVAFGVALVCVGNVCENMDNLGGGGGGGGAEAGGAAMGE